MIPPPPSSTLFPYTTLFRSGELVVGPGHSYIMQPGQVDPLRAVLVSQQDRSEAPNALVHVDRLKDDLQRSEEHTSELQSRRDLVCRLLLEKKKQRETERQYK